MKRIRLSIILITTLFILSGCRATKNQSVKFQKKDKAPSSLRDISSGLQDILKSIETVEKILDGTYVEEESKDNKQQQKESEGDQGGGQGQDSGSQGSSGQDEGSSQSTSGVTINVEKKNKSEEEKRSEQNKEELLKNWQQMDKKIEEIHKNWNDYEPEGAKKGVAAEKVDNFRLSLNLLTKAIEERNIREIYDYGSQSMLSLGSIISLYRDDIGGEVNKIKYGTYQAYINSLEGKNIKASDLLRGLEEDIDKIRLKFEKDDVKVKIIEKFNLSIEDMRKALSDKSVKLIRIKKDIIIDNLGEIEK